MPAAAVIPAPIAYIKVVAVKKLVVGFLDRTLCPPLCGVYLSLVSIHPCREASSRLICRLGELHLLL